MPHHHNVVLKDVSREDVSRIRRWLEDEEVAENWFGRYSYGDPAHLGYHPDDMEAASEEEFHRTFDDPEHRIFSIYTAEGGHIGEIHLAIEESLGDAQISVLIGRKDMWHQGFGTAATMAVLDVAFNEYGLYRAWVDIPEYNESARHMFEHIGFTHEGTLRKSRPHEGARYDSVVMGILAAEYAQHTREDESSHMHVV